MSRDKRDPPGRSDGGGGAVGGEVRPAGLHCRSKQERTLMQLPAAPVVNVHHTTTCTGTGTCSGGCSCTAGGPWCNAACRCSCRSYDPRKAQSLHQRHLTEAEKTTEDSLDGTGRYAETLDGLRKRQQLRVSPDSRMPAFCTETRKQPEKCDVNGEKSRRKWEEKRYSKRGREQEGDPNSSRKRASEASQVTSFCYNIGLFSPPLFFFRLFISPS